jgi:CSLREA domain-containing protein
MKPRMLASAFDVTFVPMPGIMSLLLVCVLGSGDAGAQLTNCAALAGGARLCVVNSTGDAPDAAPGIGGCDTGALTPQGQPECTLRAAIEENLFVTDDLTIQFNIGTGTPTIAVGAATGMPLPLLRNKVTMNGNTGGADRVELDGSLAGPGAHGLGLIGGDSIIRRLVVNRFSAHGILISGSEPPGAGGHSIQETFIGTDTTGTVTDPDGIPDSGDELGNGCDGVFVEDTPDNTMGGLLALGGAGGNVISGNRLSGVRILGRDPAVTLRPQSGAPSNAVQSNLIGTDADGSAALGNGTTGLLGAVVDLGGADSQLTAAVFADFVGCNGLRGDPGLEHRIITLTSGPAAGQSRRITAHAGPTITVPDFSAAPAAGDAFVLGDGVSISGARNGMVGGSVAGEGNLISGNRAHGVSVAAVLADDNRVQDNTIGPNRVRSAVLPNGADGVIVIDGPERTVVTGNTVEGNLLNGVRVAAARTTEILANFIGSATLPNGGAGVLIERGAQVNLVSQNRIGNNLGHGIAIRDAGTEGNSITANDVLGNQANGVLIADNARLNIIGGLIAAARNAITGNLQRGVSILGDGSVGNAILRNSIFDNGPAGPVPPGLAFLGIDLGDDGVTGNDGGDADTGPNNRQNFPVLSSVTSSDNSLTIEGSLATTPDATLSPLPPATLFRLEFFASAQCDPSGFGEGQTFLGSTDVEIDGNGNANFAISFPAPAAQVITATATSLTPNPTAPASPLPTNTSEFSECRTVAAAPGVPGDVTGDGLVNCADLAVVRGAFGRRFGQPGFDARADTNDDGIVDIRDLAFVARQLPVGTQCP